MLGFYGHTGRSNTHIPREQNGPCNPQRCVVNLQTKSPQPSWRPHVHGRQRRNPFQQLSRPQHFTDDSSSHVIRSRLGALFINAKTAVSIRQTLIKLGHPQPLTLMQTDNAMAHTLLTNKILPIAFKAMDMHFHWLWCRNAQGKFCYYWRPGTQNLADYFTKHHPATHHKSVRPTILTAVNNPEYRKLFQNTGDSTRSEGTNNYARNKNFQKSPKIAETEGTKNYAQNKTSKNLQKITKLEGTINTPPRKKLRYCQKIVQLEVTKNTPPSKNLQYPQKIAELEGTKIPPQAKICDIAKNC
jgi:hypothetical protein